MKISDDIKTYLASQTGEAGDICRQLQIELSKFLPDAENKVWHAHPVWFLDRNPIVGYSHQRQGVRLMFWSGASFDEPELLPGTGKYKDASKFYQSAEEINSDDLYRWVEKAKKIQWDYKNIVRNKGILNRLK